jgi:MGT family glycosyltransferase
MVLKNDAFFAKLKKKNFDFAVIDGSLRCFFIIPHRLGVPFASLCSAHLFDLRAIGLQAPMLVPGFEARERTTMTMIDKLKKFVTYVAAHTLLELDSRTYSPDKPYNSLHEIANRASLYLYDTSRVFDTPIPISPNVIHVGGLTTRKPETLPPGTIKTFLDEAKDGFILVSFGSVVKYFPEHVVRILVDAISSIKLRVLFKINKSVIPGDLQIPENILTQEWIPQKDVLGHKNIRLFITHCGSGGQHEALYSAVPMLGIPIFADQTYNSKRMQVRGFGRHLGIDVINKEALLGLINEILQNKTYKLNIEKASGLFREQPMAPSETGAYWIDHVMKYGDAHLKSATNDLSWVQILMLDVLVVVVAILSFIILLFVCIIRCCYRCLCKKRKEKVN